MFIVIDGIDGSWKGTQVKLLEERLNEKNKKVLILDYPRYWKESTFFVEKYLNWWYWKNVSAKQASLFYALDRFDELCALEKSFKNYDYIISNRYVSASMIHQAGKITDEKEKQDFIKWLDDLEYNILNIPRPDKTFFLNVTPKMSKKLLEKKEDREYIKNSNNLDIHEEDSQHIENAWNSAMNIVNMFDDWEKIDCEKNWEMMSIEEINKIILDKIES